MTAMTLSSIHQIFSGCFDCTAILVPGARKLRRGKTNKKNRSNKPASHNSQDDEPTTPGHQRSQSLSRTVATQSTDSMATASTFDSTISGSPSLLDDDDDDDDEEDDDDDTGIEQTESSLQTESPGTTICFLPHAIDTNRKQAEAPLVIAAAAASSFFFLPFPNEFVDLQRTNNDEEDYGYFVGME